MTTSHAETPLRYPLSLALFDYAPVALTPAALAVLLFALPADFGSSAPWALAGLALMFAGGFCKATWKTIIAATERDIRWMEHALFPLLAPGAALFAWASWFAARSAAAGAPSASSVAVPLLLGAAFIAASLLRLPRSPKKWFLPMVALLTVSMGMIAGYAAVLAQRHGSSLAASLFVAGFAVSLITAGLSRRAATIAAQWVMEAANTGSGMLFLAGALQLYAALPAGGSS